MEEALAAPDPQPPFCIRFEIEMLVKMLDLRLEDVPKFGRLSSRKAPQKEKNPDFNVKDKLSTASLNSPASRMLSPVRRHLPTASSSIGGPALHPKGQLYSCECTHLLLLCVCVQYTTVSVHTLYYKYWGGLEEEYMGYDIVLYSNSLHSFDEEKCAECPSNLMTAAVLYIVLFGLCLGSDEERS